MWRNNPARICKSPSAQQTCQILLSIFSWEPPNWEEQATAYCQINHLVETGDTILTSVFAQIWLKLDRSFSQTKTCSHNIFAWGLRTNKQKVWKINLNQCSQISGSSDRREAVEGFFLSKVRMKEAFVTGLIADQRKELPIADQCVLFSTHRILLRAALGSASSITTRRKLLWQWHLCALTCVHYHPIQVLWIKRTPEFGTIVLLLLNCTSLMLWLINHQDGRKSQKHQNDNLVSVPLVLIVMSLLS